MSARQNRLTQADVLAPGPRFRGCHGSRHLDRARTHLLSLLDHDHRVEPSGSSQRWRYARISRFSASQVWPMKTSPVRSGRRQSRLRRRCRRAPRNRHRQRRKVGGRPGDDVVGQHTIQRVPGGNFFAPDDRPPGVREDRQRVGRRRTLNSSFGRVRSWRLSHVLGPPARDRDQHVRIDWERTALVGPRARTSSCWSRLASTSVWSSVV